MPRFQDQDVIELRGERASLLAAPQFGGRLLKWQVDGREILYWPDAPDWRRPAKIRGGDPLLFPFVARHFVDGQPGRWRDAQGTVRELPIHGFARDQPFTAEVDDDGLGLRMRLDDSDATRPGYPFSFEFEVHYRLAGTALEVSLTTHNSGPQALPYYAGHHFYFALPAALRPSTTLSLPPARRQRQEADGSLSSSEADSSVASLDDGSLIDCFHVLQGGTARLVRMKSAGTEPAIEIELDPEGIEAVPGVSDVPWFAVTTWTESAASDFYCIEPWLGLPNAISHGVGLRWLASGATERASCRLRVSS